MNLFQKIPSKSGTTLIELMVAVVLMSILIPVVYACWTRINSHILTRQRTAALQVECNRLADAIAAEIRRSEAIISWDESSICIVAESFTDTITYSFTGLEFERNGHPVTILLPHTKVIRFSVDNQNEGYTQSSFLLSFTIALGNRHGDSASVSTTLTACTTAGQRLDNDFMW